MMHISLFKCYSVDTCDCPV